LAEKSTGNASKFGLVIGEVVNRLDDPTQSGQCKVRWNMGQINQSDLSEGDLPWSKPLSSGHQGAIRGIGKAPLGFIGSSEGKAGTKVYGFSFSGDGQDMHILGPVHAAGKGGVDGQPEYDSDLPQPSKVESNGQGGGQQPRHGDKNGVAEDYKDESVVKYAEDRAGPEKSSAKYKDLDDSAGTVGGSDGPEGKAQNDLIEV
jgi:hypothetical protein